MGGGARTHGVHALSIYAPCPCSGQGTGAVRGLRDNSMKSCVPRFRRVQQLLQALELLLKLSLVVDGLIGAPVVGDSFK